MLCLPLSRPSADHCFRALDTTERIEEIVTDTGTETVETVADHDRPITDLAVTTR